MVDHHTRSGFDAARRCFDVVRHAHTPRHAAITIYAIFRWLRQ